MTDPEIALAESMTFAIGEAEIAELRRRLDDASRNGKTTLLTPLPRRVRLRLWARGRIDRLAIWLIGHHCCWLAERAWRACGMWSR